MGMAHRLARSVLEDAHRTFVDNVLRDRIEPTENYVAEILAWFERSYQRWLASTGEPNDLDAERPAHWGGTVPLRDIVAMVAGHWHDHAGEINEILAIRRGEAVEETHISTVGHGVRRPWMSEEYIERSERRLREIAEGRP
jgi:hypothetical protein